MEGGLSRVQRNGGLGVAKKGVILAVQACQGWYMCELELQTSASPCLCQEKNAVLVTKGN